MITQDYKVVSPAYGRDYKSKKEVEADFFGGKDFVMESIDCQPGCYCSMRDFAPGTKVEVRYAKMTKVVILEVRV